MSSAAIPARTTRQDLQRLIENAATGDSEHVRRLVVPFLTSDERLIWSGVLAKLGIFATYSFAFVTDRRVGNLVITPFTGSVHSTTCYLQHIDAQVLIQPAFPIWLRVMLGLMYVLSGFLVKWIVVFLIERVLYFSEFYEAAFNAPSSLWGYPLLVLGPLATHFWLRPALIWYHLRFRKSGILLKLREFDIGALILADRNQFAALIALSRAVTEQKRLVDAQMT